MSGAQEVGLKPCPFCGGATNKVVSPLGFGNIKAIECNGATCAITGPWGRNEAEAIAAWNTRHAEAAVGAREARLREALRSVDALLCGHGLVDKREARSVIRAALTTSDGEG